MPVSPALRRNERRSADLRGEPDPAPSRASLRERAPAGLRDIVLGLLVWGIYTVLAEALSGQTADAVDRGRSLLRAERWLHIDVERSADHWLAPHRVLGWLAAWEYATTYILTTFLVLGWIWWRRPRHYAWARNTLLWTTLLAMACFAFWPTAPPRLLPGEGFVDIVAQNHPLLSWGGGTVSAGANQYAAMPSLHIGWAVWVSVVTLRARATRTGSAVAALHVALTALVIVATGNHYLLDIAGGFAVVGLAVALERGRQRLALRLSTGERVAAADEFFLHVETAQVEQPVGGFVMLDRSRGPDLALDSFKQLMAERLPLMPRLEQQLRPAGWLRHARWVPARVDLHWHVREHVLPNGGGRRELARFIASLTEQQLDRSKPLWQLWYVPNVGPNESSAVAIMHHAVGDGLGVVDILRQLFDPMLPPPDLSGIRRPSAAARALGAAAGIAELAADGAADALPFTQPLTGRRDYSMTMASLPWVRDLARRLDVHVTDLVLAGLGHALAERVAEHDGSPPGQRLRVAVPVTTRLPAPPGTGRRPTPGNLTAALRLDVPVDRMPMLERLHLTHRLAHKRRRSARALGSAAVMRATGAFPPPIQRFIARRVYRSRYFTAILSNMPGPDVGLDMLATPICDVYPILPLADGVPVGVGTLGWAGQFCLSIITDSGVLPDAQKLAQRLMLALREADQAARSERATDQAEPRTRLQPALAPSRDGQPIPAGSRDDAA